jgi:hypothetical protein
MTNLIKGKKKAADGQATIAQQTAAAIAQGPAPSVTDVNVMDAVELENKKAKKRKGRASTLLGGAYEAPVTSKSILESKY